MEHTQQLPRALRLSGLWRPDPAAVATWALGAALVVYLALQDGGYDAIVRGEVGVAVWWVALCTVACGALPLPLRSRAAIALAVLLGGFVAWTALSLTWTASSERTATELARVATYLGFLVLALAAVANGERARSLLNGITFAVGLVMALAVLSRLHPAWFPANTLGTALPGIEIERRLAYPLNYSSAVGVFAAIAFPLLLGATAWARTLAGQALAAAALSIAGFAFVLASSGTGTGVAIITLVAFFALVPDRLPKLGSLGLAAAGTWILSTGLSDRPALDRGLPTPEALSQGNDLLVIALLVCVGVALAQTGIGLAVRYGERPRALSFTRAQAWVATGLVVVAVIPLGLAAGAPGTVSDSWESFKDRTGSADQTDRGSTLLDTSSSGRYQLWQGAIDAGKEDPLKGIGPGTFEYYWAGSPDNFGPVRDAHSLYLESFAELGVVGFALIVALVGGTLGIGLVRSLRAPPAARLRIAAATAAAAGFAAGAALDWIWEIAALPAIFLALAAVITTDRESDPLRPDPARQSRQARSRLASAGPRVALAILAVAAIVTIALPLRSAVDLRDSQIDAATGALAPALQEADSAVDAQPYAAAPRIQQATVLELQGDFDRAVAAARVAVEKEPTNWKNWAVLSRLEVRAGNNAQAIQAYRRARTLNPKILGASA